MPIQEANLAAERQNQTPGSALGSFSYCLLLRLIFGIAKACAIVSVRRGPLSLELENFPIMHIWLW